MNGPIDVSWARSFSFGSYSYDLSEASPNYLIFTTLYFD